MESYKYDAFISYRRKGGDSQSALLRFALIEEGIAPDRIFLDTRTLTSTDNYELKIEEAIAHSANLLVVISKGCFDQQRERDMMEFEILTAQNNGVNIIPVFFDGITSFDNIPLPQSIQSLSLANGVTYNHEYSNAVYSKIRSFLVNVQAEQQEQKPKQGRSKVNLSIKTLGCLMTVALGCVLVFVLPPSFWVISNPDVNPSAAPESPWHPNDYPMDGSDEYPVDSCCAGEYNECDSIGFADEEYFYTIDIDEDIYYHLLTCPTLNGYEAVEMISKDVLDRRGITPCPHCHPDQR